MCSSSPLEERRQACSTGASYEVETPDGARSPVVLLSEDGESRVVLIALDPGEEMGDHQVKEAALVLVVSGEARIEAGGDAIRGVAGDLFRFERNERHAVSTEGGARLLLMLTPWPGEGHYRGERGGASASWAAAGPPAASPASGGTRSGRSQR